MNFINLKLKRLCAAIAVVGLIAGCSSGVPLEQPPVEDKNAVPTMGGPGMGGGANAGGTAQSGVAGVNLGHSQRDGAGPVGAARVIYFDFDSYAVKPEFQATLDAHARFIKASPAGKVMLEGHTDERGGREYNLALGQKRAEAVRRSLGLLGVSDGQMEAVSFGKEKTAAQGSTEDAHAQNRRVELSYR